MVAAEPSCSKASVVAALSRNNGARLFGAASKFWKPIAGTPVSFDHHTELLAETRVWGTDRASTFKFAPYWALIRRSWLAAIERRARVEPSGEAIREPGG